MTQGSSARAVAPKKKRQPRWERPEEEKRRIAEDRERVAMAEFDSRHPDNESLSSDSDGEEWVGVPMAPPEDWTTRRAVDFCFSDLARPLKANLDDLGIQEPRYIQQRAFVPVMDGDNIVLSTKIGSGTTAAYAIPLVQRILQDGRRGGRYPFAFIVCPTRELAEQVYLFLLELTRNSRIGVVCSVGGLDRCDAKHSLQRGCDIVVATNGRLRDHLLAGDMNCDGLQTLVLEEAELLLKYENTHRTLKYIKEELGALPQVITVATDPDNRFVQRFNSSQLDGRRRRTDISMGSPLSSKVEVIPFLLGRNPMLHELQTDLENERYQGTGRQTVVVVSNDSAVEEVMRGLRIPFVRALKSSQRQDERSRVLEEFRKDRFDVLVTTDASVRGLCIPSVRRVISADFPDKEMDEKLTHRFGLVGHSNGGGMAIAYCSTLRECDDLNRRFPVPRH